jgi:hypothetical protein
MIEQEHDAIEQEHDAIEQDKLDNWCKACGHLVTGSGA